MQISMDELKRKTSTEFVMAQFKASNGHSFEENKENRAIPVTDRGGPQVCFL
jgi:hypothetical protein